MDGNPQQHLGMTSGKEMYIRHEKPRCSHISTCARYYYIMPGADRKSGTLGQDFFLGEDALVSALNSDHRMRKRYGIVGAIRCQRKAVSNLVDGSKYILRFLFFSFA